MANLTTEDLASTFIVVGFTHLQLFDGNTTTELLLVDPTTGEDFSIPVADEAIAELMSRRVRDDQVEDPVRERPAAPADSSEVQNAKAPTPPAKPTPIRAAIRPQHGGAVEAEQL